MPAPRLEDLRLFAAVAAARSFTAAAGTLGVPKQTLSRRIAELEATLGVQLLHRTTRRLTLTEPGATFARRCAEVVALAADATRALTDAREQPRGTLRVTADPVFGDAYLAPLLIAYARRHPEVELDVVLTRRHVDLLEESFDVAFRVGTPDARGAHAISLGPARIHYCASPAYLKRRGRPASAADLQNHELIAVGEPPHRWPFRDAKRTQFVAVEPHLRLGSLTLAHAAVRAALGVTLLPAFIAQPDLDRRRLTAVLAPETPEAGGIWLLHQAAAPLPSRTRAFLDLAVPHLRATLT